MARAFQSDAFQVGAFQAGDAVALAGQSDGVSTVPAAALKRSYNLAPSAVAGVGNVPAAALLRVYNLTPVASSGAGVASGVVRLALALVPSTVPGVGNVPGAALKRSYSLTPSVVAGVGNVPGAALLRLYNLTPSPVAGAGTAVARLVEHLAMRGQSIGLSVASSQHLTFSLRLNGQSIGLSLVPSAPIQRLMQFLGINSHGLSIATGTLADLMLLRGQSGGLSSASSNRITFALEQLHGQAVGAGAALGNLSHFTLGLRGQSLGQSLAFGDLDVIAVAVAAVYGKGSAPKGLGLVRWQAISPEGEAMILRLGESESFETAAGGYKSAHGFVAGGLVDRYSRILADGSFLRSIFVPTEEVLWGGRLLDPAPEGGKANITAEGYGLDAGRIFERLLWKNPNPGDWSEQGAAPALVPADDDKISVSIGDGEIKLTVSDGTVFDGGEGNGAVFPAFPEGVSRLTFTVKKKSTTDKYVVRVHGGPGPEYDAATWVKFGDDIVLTDSGPSLVDVAIDGDVGLIAIDLSRYVVEPTTGATSYWVKVTDLVVYGRTAEDEYSGSSMMRDLYGMLGISALGVTELGGNALPRDVRASSAEQVANDLAVLMDARWGIYDTGSKEYGTFGAWGETTWIAPTTRGIHPLPLRRYDSVGCPYQTSNPKVNGLAVVAAPYKLKTSRMFPVEISGDLPTEDVAIAICTTLAPFLVEPRFVLDATLTKLIDQAGCEWSAHRARCGHSLIVPGFDMPFRLWTLRRTDRAVQVTSPDSQDRINATVAQALARAA